MIRILQVATDKEAYVSHRNENFIKEALRAENVRFHNVNSDSDLEKLGISSNDVVIVETRDGFVRQALSKLGCKTTLESDRTIILTQNKEVVKEELQRYGISHPKTYKHCEVEDGHSYFVKPKLGEDSNFVDNQSVCQSVYEVRKRCRTLAYHGCHPMIEDFIEGEEYTVACIRFKEDLEIYPLKVNLSTPWNIMTHEAKFSENEICETVNDYELKKIAAKAFEVVGCQHYMRIDFRKGLDGKFYLIDFNLYPGLGPTDHFAKCISLYSDVSYKEVLKKVIASAT